ncbi:alpha/beta-hydrolase [Auriscalpium vulgare]|uniref:Alpha/beta-hydrolase n=1 Tax=Auriscalpium vulgare TaxID=40419 RepID=A0ACB8RFQ4_9AGAM|nr:alpha/beta-hydrolase [Auriscalpium vulgare]
MTTLRQRNAESADPQASVHEPTVPENLRTVFDPATCARKGLCPVSKIRKQGDTFESHSLYFEQHGTGPEKVVFVMGLNSTSFAWSAQVEHFGRSPNYSVLVFDNRGVGNSDTPKGPYSSSGMAEDIIVLLDYIGWTEERSLHLVGISLGGMISQGKYFLTFLAFRIPERFVSLTLAVTTAGGRPWSNIPPMHGFISLTRLLFIADNEKKIPIIVDMVYNTRWLDTKAENDSEGRTNREVQTASYRRRIAVTRPQKPLGALSQMWAGLSHSVSPARLRHISASIPKVLIITGDEDHLVRPSESKYLKDHMPEAEYTLWENTGHALHGQYPKKFNPLLERVFGEGAAKVKSTKGN